MGRHGESSHYLGGDHISYSNSSDRKKARERDRQDSYYLGGDHISYGHVHGSDKRGHKSTETSKSKEARSLTREMIKLAIRDDLNKDFGLRESKKTEKRKAKAAERAIALAVGTAFDVGEQWIDERRGSYRDDRRR